MVEVFLRGFSRVILFFGPMFLIGFIVTFLVSLLGGKQAQVWQKQGGSNLWSPRLYF